MGWNSRSRYLFSREKRILRLRLRLLSITWSPSKHRERSSWLSREAGIFAVFMRSNEFLGELIARVRSLAVGH